MQIAYPRLQMPIPKMDHNLKILHLTTLHPRSDTRIFIKEVQTLASLDSCKVVLMVADGKGHEKSDQSSVEIHDLGLLGGSRIGRIVKSFLKVVADVQAIRPRVVHFHDPELMPLGVFLKMLGYRVIYDAHEDLRSLVYSRKGLSPIIQKVAAGIVGGAEQVLSLFFDSIVSATPKIASRFKEARVVTVQNFPLTIEMWSPSFTPYWQRPQSFVYVGYNTVHRGAIEMVRALEYLKEYPNAKLELAGSFSPESLLSQVGTLPGWANIGYHGHVNRERMASLLGGARAGLVLFHPLPNHIDAQPNKMFEYMSAGLPIIVSDFPLWRKIVEDAGCGLVANPLDPKDIARALTWILDHPEEAARMGERGRQAVVNIYNWEKEGQKLVSLYRRLLPV